MIVITNRPAYRKQLEHVIPLDVDTPPLTLRFRDSIQEAITAVAEETDWRRFVAVDLSSVPRGEELQELVWAVKAKLQYATIIGVLPMVTPAREIQLLQHLQALLPSPFLVKPDEGTMEGWRRLMDVPLTTELATLIRNDLAVEAQKAELRLAHGDIVLHALEGSTRVHSAREVTVRRGLSRTELRRQCLKHFGCEPKEVITTLRVLWYVFLRERGFSQQAIARFLHFSTPEECARTMRRATGLPLRELNQLTYSVMVNVTLPYLGAVAVSREGEDLLKRDLPSLRSAMHAVAQRGMVAAVALHSGIPGFLHQAATILPRLGR